METAAIWLGAFLFTVIPGRTARCEPGIQNETQRLHLDSGFAHSRAPE